MRRTIEVDMSPEAIDQRLRDLGQLYKLGLSFRDVRYIGRSEDLKAQRLAKAAEAAGPEQVRHETAGENG